MNGEEERGGKADEGNAGRERQAETAAAAPQPTHSLTHSLTHCCSSSAVQPINQSVERWLQEVSQREYSDGRRPQHERDKGTDERGRERSLTHSLTHSTTERASMPATEHRAERWDAAEGGDGGGR